MDIEVKEEVNDESDEESKASDSTALDKNQTLDDDDTDMSDGIVVEDESSKILDEVSFLETSAEVDDREKCDSDLVTDDPIPCSQPLSDPDPELTFNDSLGLNNPSLDFDQPSSTIIKTESSSLIHHGLSLSDPLNMPPPLPVLKEKKRKREKTKKELEEEEREKWLVLLSHFTEAQLDHYEMYRRSAFPRPAIKRLMQTLTGTTISQNVGIAMAGIAKVFVGEVVEEALDVKEKVGDVGPIQPKHIREAVRRMRRKAYLPNTKPHRPLT